MSVERRLWGAEWPFPIGAIQQDPVFDGCSRRRRGSAGSANSQSNQLGLLKRVQECNQVGFLLIRKAD